MLLLYLSLLLAGRRGCFSSDPSQIAPLNSDVCLPCPGHTGSGDVTWERQTLGGKVTPLTIKNGHIVRLNSHYDVSTNGSLVIYNVQESDESLYDCNKKKIYLNVTSDPNMAAATARPGCSVPRTTGSGPGLDQDVDQAQWKIPVAVVMGGLVVLVAMLVLKLLLRRRRRRSAAAESDRIYEEIQDPEVETPYYTSITDTHTDTHTDTDTHTNAHTDTHTALYSTVNKPKPECVYSLAQKPDAGTD